MAVKPLTRIEAYQSLQSGQLDVAFSTAFTALVSGSFLVGFIQYLGGGAVWVGLSAAIPAVIGLLQVVGAPWGRQKPSYKPFVRAGGLTWRLLYIPVVLLPVLTLPDGMRLALLMLCIAIGAVALQIVSPIYGDWIAEMIPEGSRGWYFSRRQALATGASVAAGLIGALLIDFMTGKGLDAVGFALVFGLGVICALISQYFFDRMKDAPRSEPAERGVKEALSGMIVPLRDKAFRPVLVFTAIFAISQGYAGPHFAAYSLEVLNLPFTVLQLNAVSFAVATILFSRMWGWLGDRYGAKPVLAIAVAGTIFAPLVWQFTVPDRLFYNATILIAAHLFNGLVWSGANVTLLSLYLASSPARQRASYLATSTALQFAALGVAPMLGSLTLEALLPGGDPVFAYKVVFGGIIGLRVASFIAILPVREPGAQPIREALKQIMEARPAGLRALKRLRVSADEGEREEAAEAIGKERLRLGAGDLAKALSDPSPRVRRSAANSLASVQSPEVAQIVADLVRDRPELVEEEALELLAETHAPEAAGLLIRYLENPRSILRRTAARGLGALGDPSAIPALKLSAGQTEDPDLRRASLQALRRLRGREAAKEIVAAIQAEQYGVRTAAAEAAAVLELTEAAPSLRELLKRKTEPEAAYALGRVGTMEDLPLILEIAQKVEAESLRRRCLMGVARLLGVEPGFYSLIGLDDMGRSAALMRVGRDTPEVKPAIERYSTGDEAGALRQLSEIMDDPALRLLAETPAEEAFLAAALAAAKQN